ncbi:MAG: gamma-glutamyltransferase family protein [Chloroflexota bacterium]|nr:gamma-glutamyltransferase family protein [Chloroflexota bacterium]
MQYDFEFRSRRSNVMATHGMVASSQPLASLAGLDMLRKGGNAADAAIAVAAALNVVEPFSNGVGGDCFVLYWDAKDKKVFALNGSGPSAEFASIDDLKRAGYEKHPLYTGHAVSVPGAVAGWSTLRDRFGTMSFQELLAPAIRYAFEGYPVTEWIGATWKLSGPRLLRENLDESKPKHFQVTGPAQPSGNEFLIDGRAPNVGEVIKLPTLGETLKNIAEFGKDYIYTGEFAKKLCEHVQKYDGWLETSDLEGFEAEWVDPIYADYHGVRLYECPPNGQGLAAIMAAKIANGFEIAIMDNLERTHTLIDCMRLGFVEALNWVSDPKFGDIPYTELFAEDYIQNLRTMIRSEHAIKHLKSDIHSMGDDTVYLSVVDGDGNACSFITSLYTGPGTGLVVPGTGVLLQNRGALFSLDPEHPNALVGGKRPYHTIIPGMITKDDELFASFGIMGGFMQPQAHLQVLSNMVDFNHNPQQALDMPRFNIDIHEGEGVGSDDSGGAVLLERGFSFEEMAALSRKGHQVTPVSGLERIIFGGGQVIQRETKSGVLIAGSDPRKDGSAIGF